MSMTKAQMVTITKTLNDQGFGVTLREDEQTDVPYDDIENPPMWFSIDWGNWSVNQDGELFISDDFFPVNDCDLVEFIKSVHGSIHEVGGAVITQ